MSNMYAIKEETLTALGDVIRDKNGLSNEYHHIDSKVETISGNISRALTLTRKSKIIINILEIVDTFPTYSESYITIYNNDTLIKRWELKDRDNLYFEGVVDAGELRYTHYYGNYKFDLTIIPLDENGNEFKYTPSEMVNKVNELDIIPNEALNISGYCGYRFSSSGWNWFIEQAGDKITTNNISSAIYMFEGNGALENIPFEINLQKNIAMSNMFSGCYNLKALPQVNIPAPSTHVSFSYLFNNCQCIREIPAWVGDFLEQDYNLGIANSTFGPYNAMFSNCYSLRTIPEKVMKYLANPTMTGNYYGVAYSKPFVKCATLDELLNIHCDNYNYTSNQFNGFFEGLARVKSLTFAKNEDGTPVIRSWKSQTFDFSSSVGYWSNVSFFINYNSGITADKQVKDDATYQALKNDPDWFSIDLNYSRYNHDSAVETINSLPDCSATGTNTIKFKGQAGSKTDGGAINTLTEEEIAVAAAKGWVVSYV